MKLFITSLILLNIGCAHTYMPIFKETETQPKEGFVRTKRTLFYCLLENNKPVCYETQFKYKNKESK